MRQNILAVIGARSGSKGLPGKNIRPLHGKPLLAWAIEAAKRSKYITRVVLSTDSEEYAAIGRQYGAETPFLRPADLANDTAADFDWLHHATLWLKEHEGWQADLIVRLHPTSPLVRTEDIDTLIEKMMEDDSATSAYMVTKVSKHPYKMWREAGDGYIAPFISEEITGMKDAFNKPRQSFPQAFSHCNAAVIRWKTLIEEQSMAGKKVASHYIDQVVDIDTLQDFERAEAVLRKAEEGGNILG
jgi:CMP-N-acetylneuraminic acid synthetase